SLRRSPGWALARTLPRGSRKRSAAFAALREEHGFREYDLHRHPSLSAGSWLRQHLDITTAQKVATRAFRAAERYSFGLAGRPHFKRYGELGSVEGKSHASGIRFRDDRVLWQGEHAVLDLPLVVTPGDEVQEHGLEVAHRVASS